MSDIDVSYEHEGTTDIVFRLMNIGVVPDTEVIDANLKHCDSRRHILGRGDFLASAQYVS